VTGPEGFEARRLGSAGGRGLEGRSVEELPSEVLETQSTRQYGVVARC
jgi:hypothetical protein